MAEVREVTVPDIGDFADVPVIEILVAAGDTRRPRGSAGHARVRQGDDGRARAVGRRGARAARRRRRQGLRGHAAARAIASRATAPGRRPRPSARRAGARPPRAPRPPRRRRSTPRPRPRRPRRRPTQRRPRRSPQPPPAEPVPDAAPPYASPSVRRLARERGVDLAGVERHGPQGPHHARGPRAPRGRAGAAAAPRPRRWPGLLPWPQVDFAKFGPVERVALSRIKRLSGPNLARNWVMIPHVTHNDEADITELEAFRKATNAANPDVKVTMVALLMKACVASLQAYPGPQRVARRRRPRAQALLEHRLRGRHAAGARRAGHQGRRPQGHPRRRARADGALGQGARGQAQDRPTCRARRSRSRASAASAARASRRSSTRPRWRSSA